MNWIRSRSIIFRIIGVVTLIALFGLVGVTTPAPAAAAQQAQGVEVPEFSTYTLFTNPDNADMKPDVLQQLADAIRKAQAPGNCALGRLKLRVAKGGNPLLEEAVGQVRRDAVLRALDSLGVPVAGRLFVETSIVGGNEGADTRYEPARDKKPPILSADSDPKKGEPVKAGRQIKVTIKARDGDGQWETGIKTIRLVADSEGGLGRVIDSKNFEPCAEPKEHLMTLIYNVPPNPPPIVRLTAKAEDHAGNYTSQVAEFPVPGERTHYYSVQVKASMEYVYSCSPCYKDRKDPIGTETSRVVWRGTWPRVPMTAVTQASGQGETWVTSFPAGRIEATFSYDNTFPSSKCAGQITVSGPGIMGTLEGSRPASGEGKSHVKFGGRAEPSVWGTQRVCSKVPDTWGTWGRDMTTPEGVLLEADSGASTYVGFSRDDSGSFFPLDDLLTGKGFTLNVNDTKKGTDGADGSSWKWTGSASVVITPVQ